MLPFFYSQNLIESNSPLVLDEYTSRHIAQVLRMKEGEQLQLTNGKGRLYTANITDIQKGQVQVGVQDRRDVLRGARRIAIGISFLKNANRFEWFLEKVTEIGISEIIPLLCERTERQHFRNNRMKNILVSAMLQSRQCWLPQLHEPTLLEDAIRTANHRQKFIAHCMEDQKSMLPEKARDSLPDGIMLIGPEGDFTKREVELAIQLHFIPVSLGENRLRSETAAVVAATLLQLMN